MNLMIVFPNFLFRYLTIFIFDKNSGLPLSKHSHTRMRIYSDELRVYQLYEGVVKTT